MPVEVFRARTPMDARNLQEKHRKAMLDEVQRLASIDSANETLRQVVQTSPVDQGAYKASWEVKMPSSGRPTMLINDAPYAGVIEAGARPHWAPLEPLIEWARRKAGDLSLAGLVAIRPANFTKSGRFRGQAGLDDSDSAAIEAFARGVQLKIAAKGQAPKWIMRNQLPFARKSLARAFEFYLARGVRGNGAGSPDVTRSS